MIRRLPTLTLLVPLLLAACGPTTSVPPSSEASQGVGPTASSAASQDPAPTGSPAAATTVRAYFILGSHTDDSGLVPVLREVPATGDPAKAAMTALLAGPAGPELAADPAMYSWIPAGTKLVDLTIADGVATASFSKEFGAPSSDAYQGELAQVVYTFTQFPTITGVQIRVDGQLIVYSMPPLARVQFTKFLPPIWVDEPAWGGTLGNPAHVSGLTDVFEAQFRIEILDAAGHSLADQPATASCGSGCWGTFDVSVPYTVATAQQGTLRVYDLSAKDGSREHVVDYPVSLTP